jgi:hypothetical protein
VSVTLTRQELSDRVWTEPVDTLAKVASATRYPHNVIGFASE